MKKNDILITYLSNAGFMLTDGNTKILIDGIHTEQALNFSPIPEKIMNKIINGEEDFSNIGYGLGRMIRVFKDGFDRGIKESLDISKMDKTPFNQSEFEFEKKLRNAYYPPNFIRNSLEYKEWLKMNLEKGGEDDIHQAESANYKSV